MGSADIYSSIGKSVVKIKVSVRGELEPIIRCGIIIVCKERSAYVITDARILDMRGRRMISVEFPNGLTSNRNQLYTNNGILGIHCFIQKSFDHTKVNAVQLCEETIRSSDVVYVYEGVGETITRGNVTQIGPQMFNMTNAAGDFSEFGAPVLDKNGMLVGMCYSAEYHLSAWSVITIADCIETSHNRRFTNVRATLDHLYGII